MSDLASRTYQMNRDVNASTIEVISQLFDKMIAAIEGAVVAAHCGRIEDRHQLTSKAAAVLTGFRHALDMDNGGQIAVSLDKLYQFALMRLTEFEIKNDARYARDAISILAPLGKSWKSLTERRYKVALPPVDRTPRPSQDPAQVARVLSVKI